MFQPTSLEKKKISWKHVIGSTLAYWYTMFLGWTTKIYWFKSEEALKFDREGQNYIFGVWHNQQLFLLYPYRGQKICALISLSDDGEIVLVGREAGSGTRDGFESIVDVKDSCKYAQELTATGAVISAVEANPLAIGYASLSAVGDTVAMVTVEGVECSEDTVKDGSYKIQRPFVFVTNKSVTLSEQAQAFVDFATSKDAADLIRTAGAVPVNE